MIEMYGNIFDTEQLHIGHGVNTHGVMGAGIALQIRDRFPKNYIKYYNYCRSGELQPGHVVAMREKGWVVYNLASQDAPGPHARYEWLANSLRESVNAMLSHDDGNLLAIPEIGCGIGGLKWSVARLIILGIERELDKGHLFEVWHYQPTQNRLVPPTPRHVGAP